MSQPSPELEKKLGLKQIRAHVRLEASLRADRVLHKLEEEYAQEFDKRVQSGKPYVMESFDRWLKQAVAAEFPSG